MVWLPKERWADRLLEGLPPDIAGDTAFRMFCAPEFSERRAANHRKLVERARHHLRNAQWRRVATPVGEVQTYTFLPDRERPIGSVLVLHGWTSEASFMTAVAEPIRRSGYRVVLFDLPAHGLSAGRSTNLIDCARATVSVGNALGAFDAVVAHSFGGLIALTAAEGHAPMQGRLTMNSIALIAAPNRFTDVTDHFARHRDLTGAGKRAFEKRLERIGGRPLQDFRISRMLVATQIPALVIHAPDDEDVPFRCAEEIVAASPNAELRSFDGFGHRNILFAPQVMRAVTSYLTRTTQEKINDRSAA